MKIIGLTGGIGTGKSTVSRFLAELGAVIISADAVGHEAYQAGTEGWREVVAAFGRKFTWVKLSGDATHWQPAADGSAVLTMADGTSLAIDFSKASGADGLLVTTGQADGAKVELGGTTLTFRFLTAGPEPKPQVQGDKVVIGEQTVSLKDGNLVLGKMAEPPKAR